MADDKVYLVVMMACLDAPLAIQKTLEVLEVLDGPSNSLRDPKVGPKAKQ